MVLLRNRDLLPTSSATRFSGSNPLPQVPPLNPPDLNPVDTEPYTIVSADRS